MSILAEIRTIDSSRKALRSFGVVVGGVIVLLGGVAAWRAHAFDAPWALGLWTVGGVLMLLGLVAPPVLRWPHRVWMAVAVVLGFVMTRVILTLVYFLVVTPIGLVMRTLRRDPLHRRPDPQLESYWIPRPPEERDPSALEKYY